MLSAIPYPRGTKLQLQTSFGGLDRRAGAANGAICDMENLTGGHAPVLASRGARYHLRYYAPNPHGIFSAGRLFVAGGTTLWVDGAVAGAVSNTDKVFAALGERVVIWPDKLIWTQAEGLKSLEASVSASGLVFSDGTYAGEAAEKNTVTHPSAGFAWSDYFRAGDAVRISGTAGGANDRTPIIREIDGNKLRFYENTFAENRTETGTVTLARTAPDLDFLCSNENRIWGCKGDTVWCCKLGDPYNWNVFDGLSTDAWSVESGSPGDFTGCFSFLGYPCFFKEDRVFKVYGSRPGNFQMMGAATLGVLAGAHRTMAVAGENLYYLSRAGFVRYTGGLPSPIGDELARSYTGGAAGSDGVKYYVSARGGDGAAELLAYDARTGAWHREDGTSAAGMAYHRGVACLTQNGEVLAWNCPDPPAGAEAEGELHSSAEFAGWDWKSFGSKYPVRLWLRAAAADGVTLAVSVRYDGGDWESAARWQPGEGGEGYFPVPVRRCGRYALKIEADGPWKLWALEHELYVGAGNRRP